MKQTMMDKAVSKLSKGKLNTTHLTREEMADMIDKYFIQRAVTEKDYQDIWKVIKRGILFDKEIRSKDGNYKLRSKSSQGGRSFSRYVWIYDNEKDMFYEYSYYIGFYGKFKKMMKNRLAQAENKQQKK